MDLAADLAGEPIPFDRARHQAFQALLAAWGEPDYLAAKARAEASLRASGEAPPGKTESAAPAAEVARRQWRALSAGAPQRRGAVDSRG